MKNIKTRIVLVLLLLAVVPVVVNARSTTEPTDVNITSVDTSLKAEKLLNRLDEIDQMDKSDMKRAEKKQLRMEVKTIKKELRQLDGGIYLSVGAVIIIILLLILLL